MRKVGHTSELTDKLWKTQKIRLLTKWTNLPEISFYTCVPKTAIIWGTVPETQSETEFFVILDHFYPFNLLPGSNPENQKFDKNEKSIWRCHHFKLVQQKKRSYDVSLFRYGVIQIFRYFLPSHRHNFLSFQAIFCSFAPLLTSKFYIWK